jgi:hypothetical protein
MKKIIALLPILAVVLVGCSNVSTGPDQVALHYKGGPLSETEFSKCIARSARSWDGPADTHRTYPAGQRTFDFTGADGSERGAISVTDKEGVTLQVPGVATFTLNTECEALQRFHENIGIKYSAWTTEGWLEYLNAYLGNPLEKAMDQASQAYSWRDLLNNPAIRDEWESSVGRLARQFAFDQAGDDYLCAPTFAGDGECGDFALTIQKPILPEQIAEALAETAAEVERKTQASNAQQRVNIEAESLGTLTDALGGDANAAVLYKAIQDGLIDVMPVPVGSTFLVNPPASE